MIPSLRGVVWSEIPDLTLLIRRSRENCAAQEDLLNLVYSHLLKVASRLLRSTNGDTSAPQDLLHDVYLQSMSVWKGEVADRNHYLAVVTKAMKNQLVDRARKANTQRRTPTPFPGVSANHLAVVDILAIERELAEIDRTDPRAAHVVRLRYYGGCSWEETARATGVSVKMVRNDWGGAVKWLRKRLAPHSS